jgi:hypothetical protein
MFMRIRIHTAGLALAIFALVSVAPKAYADAFSFTFATDPVGCASTGNCSGIVDATGTFTTAALGATPGFSGTQTYAITSITGAMNGGAMTLLAGNTGAVWQPNPGQAVYGLFPFFPVQFSANGTQWNLIPDSLFPPGTDSLLTNSSGTIFNDVSLTITPMSVPEPSTLAFIALSLLGFFGISRLKTQAQ